MRKIEEKCAIFKDREDACTSLIEILPKYILKPEETVVLGISEGGAYFAEKIAEGLNCRMDLLLTEAIYSTVNKKLPIAMVGETEELVMHKALIDSFGISKDYIYNEASRKYNKTIFEYIQKYRNGEVLNGLEDKYVLLVDECVETSLTMLTAIKTVIALGAKNVFIVVPILDNIVYKSLLTVCDNLFCSQRIDDYISIEYYYENIDEFTFDEIDKLMSRAKIRNKKLKIKGKNKNE
ncbi:MAG: hypothetical protein KAG56_00240 [Sulfurovaceae bacterium]|nr:hypothetical protein [Sulfurovaceae bacterium]